tara:strand:- start:40 stop:1038 length:999 start_codon:yes stop_codon:yes gene_type:complete
MSDQSYDRVRQQIKNLGLKHKGGGSYEKDGKYYGRVTKQKGQYIIKKAGETKRKEVFPGSKSFDKKDKAAVDKVMNMDPDKKGYDGDKTYKNMMKTFDKVIKKDDKQGQALLQKVKDKWNKRGSLGGADKNDKKIFQGDETLGKLTSYINRAGTGEDETGPETDVKDEPKSIDKVKKKTYEVFINIPYENVEGGQGQGNEDPDDDEEKPADEQIYIDIKAENDEEAEARADVEADEAYEKLKKRNKYEFHRPDYDMMEVEVNEIESKSKNESIERKIMVKENIKNMIDNLDKGDNIEAQKNFNDTMANKVSASLDKTKTDVSKSMFKKRGEH